MIVWLNNYDNSVFPQWTTLPYRNFFIKELVKISAGWKYAIENHGLPGGMFIEKFKKYDFLCVRLIREKILIRFPYYRDVTNGRIVLLSGFIKIDGYKKGGKMDREFQRNLKEAQKYYNEYNK